MCDEALRGMVAAAHAGTHAALEQVERTRVVIACSEASVRKLAIATAHTHRRGINIFNNKS